MKDDPIIAEVHRVRETIADRFHSDLRAICDDARQRQTAAGRKPVSLPPKRVSPKALPAKKVG